MVRKTVAELSSALIVFLFVYAALSKLLHFRQFWGDMHNQPFPAWFAAALTVLVPLAELAIAAALLMKRRRRQGFWGAFVLMLLFTLYTAAILMGLFPRVPCSCGGVIRELGWAQHLLLNLFFLLLSITGIFFHSYETGDTENLQKRVSNLSN